MCNLPHPITLLAFISGRLYAPFNSPAYKDFFIYFVFLTRTIRSFGYVLCRIHYKISKVVQNPKNTPILYYKVVTYPKIYTKIIPKVGLTIKYRNDPHSQTVHHTHTQHYLSITNKFPKMSAMHKQLFFALNRHKFKT